MRDAQRGTITEVEIQADFAANLFFRSEIGV